MGLAALGTAAGCSVVNPTIEWATGLLSIGCVSTSVIYIFIKDSQNPIAPEMKFVDPPRVVRPVSVRSESVPAVATSSRSGFWVGLLGALKSGPHVLYYNERRCIMAPKESVNRDHYDITDQRRQIMFRKYVHRRVMLCGPALPVHRTATARHADASHVPGRRIGCDVR
jgi:hypothetical protein